MTAQDGQHNRLHHFAPFLAMYVGAGFGWFAIWRNDALAAKLVEQAGHCSVCVDPEAGLQLWGGRVLALVSATAIWALYTTTANNKQLHGGGLFERDPKDAKHLATVLLFIVVTWCVGALAFATHEYKIFVIATVAHIVFLCGEVGWHDPLYLPKRLGSVYT